MIYPVDIKKYRISQHFGENPDMYKRFGYLGHNGSDIAWPTGTPILAPHDGIVKEAALDANGYGWYVKIENPVEGSVLGHNKSLSVKVGDVVTGGQKVAISDNSGYSTGSHVHWGYYTIPRDRSNGYGGFINQAGLIGSTLYKGYDLSNSDSMKVAVDKLVDIMDGKYISIDEHSQIISGLDSKSTEQAKLYEIDKQKITDELDALRESYKKLLDEDSNAAKEADMFERKLRFVLQVLKIDVSVESDESVLDSAVRASVAKSISEALPSVKPPVGSVESSRVGTINIFGYEIIIYKQNG